MKLILLSDDGGEIHALRDALSHDDQLEVVSPSDLVGATMQLSDHGRSIVERSSGADAVLLTWHMPDAPALNTVSHAIRVRRAGPSISVCAPDDAAAALAAGADAVLGTPYRRSMLQALILAHRRLVQVTRTDGAGVGDPIVMGALTVVPATLQVSVGDQRASITPREFALLRHLIANHGEVCTREALLKHVWGIHFDTGTNMVDVYVYFLRRKLEGVGLKGVITTVRSVGYRLTLPGAG